MKEKGAYTLLLNFIHTDKLVGMILTTEEIKLKFPKMTNPARHSAIYLLKKRNFIKPGKNKGKYFVLSLPGKEPTEKTPIHELPDIDVVQGGEILFGYMDHLRHKIGDLESDLKEEKDRHSYDVRKLREITNELTNKANKLEKQLETAQGALRGRSSGDKKFSLAEIAKYTNRP